MYVVGRAADLEGDVTHELYSRAELRESLALTHFSRPFSHQIDMAILTTRSLVCCFGHRTRCNYSNILWLVLGCESQQCS
jgi:hypothetical protein